MNKFELHPPLAYRTSAQSIVSASSPVVVNNTLEGPQRLLILVPTVMDSSTALKRIWELAHATGMQVQLLGLCEDRAEETALRRRLVSMAALLQDDRICAQVKVEVGLNWVGIVKLHYRAGDMIVCFAEQHTGVLHRPLGQILQSNLNAPVYILSGLYTDSPLSNGYSQILAWSGSIGIIIGLFMLQVRLMSLPSDWVQTTLLILSVLAEAWLIRAWNSLFG